MYRHATNGKLSCKFAYRTDIYWFCSDNSPEFTWWRIKDNNDRLFIVHWYCKRLWTVYLHDWLANLLRCFMYVPSISCEIYHLGKQAHLKNCSRFFQFAGKSVFCGVMDRYQLFITHTDVKICIWNKYNYFRSHK